MNEIKERAHSKFSASGSERWLNCSASVAMEEASPPSEDTVWSIEGTLAHKLLEYVLTKKTINFKHPPEMVRHVMNAAKKIWAIYRASGGKMLVERRVYAKQIHPEMFGTCDVIILGDDGTLHIIDFKYGQGHIVKAEKNTQLIQYALSVALSLDHKKFSHVKMWILQPRGGGKGFDSWTITMDEMLSFWLPIWKKGVARIENGPTRLLAGHWCHWCRASRTCPEKNKERDSVLMKVFKDNPIENEEIENGIEKESSKEKEEISFEESWSEEKEESEEISFNERF